MRPDFLFRRAAEAVLARAAEALPGCDAPALAAARLSVGHSQALHRGDTEQVSDLQSAGLDPSHTERAIPAAHDLIRAVPGCACWQHCVDGPKRDWPLHAAGLRAGTRAGSCGGHGSRRPGRGAEGGGRMSMLFNS